nr:uncharacterized protein LOC109164944 [Ipomoea batatas]
MQMSWRDGTILEDSGIYTMRHMETYLGQGVSSWVCGIVKGDKNMLNDLHKKFMHDILVSNINTHKHSVIQRALEYDHSLFGRARPPPCGYFGQAFYASGCALHGAKIGGSNMDYGGAASERLWISLSSSMDSDGAAYGRL